MKEKDLQLYNTAGDFLSELEEASLENISGGVAEPMGISQGNDGKWCTVTWECSICPTHTCWC